MENMSTDNIKLLPCPFCGGDNVGVWINRSISPLIPETYEVRCYDCHFGLAQSKTKEEAIKQWNTRKPMQEIVERLEEAMPISWKCDYVGGKKDGIAEAIEIVKEVGGMNG